MNEYVPVISVTDPIGKAWERMMRICFRPFSLGKWFAFGFCAWLAHLGETGFNFPTNFNYSSPRRRPPSFPSVDQIQQWIAANFWVVPVAVVGFLLLLALGIFFIWVRSRGSFVFLEGVACNRTLVKQPWHAYRPEGNSLFKVYLLLYLAAAIVFLGIFIAAAVLAWPSFRANEFRPGALAAILLIVFVWFPLMLVYGFIYNCLEGFVVPILYTQRQGAKAACARCWREVIRPHFFPVILFFLMNILLGMGVGVATMLFGLFTCCCGFFLLALPYISAVITLPVSVLFRSYSVYFLAQISDEFKIFSEDFPSAPRGFPMVMQTPQDLQTYPPQEPPPGPPPPPSSDQNPPPG